MSAVSDLTLISKRMSYALRHGAVKLRLPMEPSGFVPVAALLKLKNFEGLTLDHIKRVVESDNKGRYTLVEKDGVFKVRANRGHTIPVEELDLEPITSPDRVPVVVHGTYSQNLPSILKTGLSRMKRNHIHFAQGHFGDVRSGYRPDVDTLIYIDLAKALTDGIPFLLSSNGVVLTAGIDGVLPPKYFLKITKRDGTLIPFTVPGAAAAAATQ
eukprot:EC726846.1.p1 GENE.EC726846.1~~EC726846.1.p1  ORF type:complete len:213 (+),score=17.59 EC726846.1:52-690(+)